MSWSSSGSRKTDHHSPFGSFARGVAIFQPLISLNCGDTIAAGRSKLGPTGAHPESASAATSGAARASVKSSSARPFDARSAQPADADTTSTRGGSPILIFAPATRAEAGTHKAIEALPLPAGLP